MRIGVIRMRYTRFGGAEMFLERFISGLALKGHDIEVFASSWPEGGGLRFRKVSTWGPAFLRPLVFAVNAGKEVVKARPDIVISLERTYCQDIYRAGDGCHREWLIRRAATVSPIKRLLIRLNPLHPVLLYLEKRLFRDKRLKKVAANSEAVKRDIIRHYGLPAEKICVIYNGIDPGRFVPVIAAEKARLKDEFGFGKDSTVVLFVGSGFERKGLMYLIRSLGHLKDVSGLKLVVAGKGRASRYEAEARRLGVEDRVVFMGPVKGALRLYQASDIFALPSVYEPFSNACLEAMSSGLPVVTSRINGASEILEDGVTGGIVDDPADALQIAEKIRPFLDSGKRTRAGALARQKASSFTVENNVNGFLELIDEVGGGTN